MNIGNIPKIDKNFKNLPNSCKKIAQNSIKFDNLVNYKYFKNLPNISKNGKKNWKFGENSKISKDFKK